MYMPTFAESLIFAGVEEVILQVYGYKCEEYSLIEFLDSLERPLCCTYTPRFDVGYNCRLAAGIPLFTMPRSAGNTFRLFLRRDVGSVEYYVDAPDPNVSIRIVVYQRVVHMAKMYIKNYEYIPKSFNCVRSRVRACALAWQKYRELDVDKFSGFRVEATVTGHITLGRALEIIRLLLPSRVVPSCVVTSGHISVQDYLAQVDETIKVALCELRGSSGRDLTRNDRIVVARMYNALGLWSRSWIGNVILTGRVGRYYSTRPSRTTINPTIPITSSESFSHWEEMIRAEALLRTRPIDPSVHRRQRKSGGVFGILAWGSSTKEFRDKRELAHWGVSNYGREWPRYLRHDSPRPQARNNNQSPSPPPADQPQPISCSPDQSPTQDGHHLPDGTNPSSVQPPACTQNESLTTLLVPCNEVSQAERFLYTRRPGCSTKEGWVCGIRMPGGGITPSFPTKRDLAHWAVNTFGKEWHHRLKVTSPPPSHSSSSHSESPLSPPSSPQPAIPLASPLPSPLPVGAPPSPLPSPSSPPSDYYYGWPLSPNHAPSSGSSGTPSDPFASPPPDSSRSPSTSDVCTSPHSPPVNAPAASPLTHVHSNVHASPVVSPAQLPQPALVDEDLELEIKEAEATLYTRRHMHPKKRNEICAVKRNGSCTKAFTTRREVAVWAVSHYRSGKWREELKLQVQPTPSLPQQSSPMPSTPAWQMAPFRLIHIATTTTGTSYTITSPPTSNTSPLQVPVVPHLMPPASTTAPLQQVQTSQEVPLTQATGSTASGVSTQLQTHAHITPSQSLSSSRPPSQATPHHAEVQLSDGDILLINNRHHRIRSMLGDGNCFFSAVSAVMTSTPQMRRHASATALREETIQYYRNAPSSELALIEDIVFYTESTSLRERADELLTCHSHSRRHWGTLTELYALAAITGISFTFGYCHSALEGVQTTTIHPLFTNLPPEVTQSVILFDGDSHYYVAEPTV